MSDPQETKVKLPLPVSALPARPAVTLANQRPLTDTKGLTAHSTGAMTCPEFPRVCPFGGACHTCPTRIQAKLTISQPDDEYEREADRVAETVMSNISASEETKQPRSRCVGLSSLGSLPKNALSHSVIPPVIEHVLHSPAHPIDASALAFLEPRFGYDFSPVRLHTGPDAAHSAETINAQAYTVGSDLVFGRGTYNPVTTEGCTLLAHELAHVVQYSQGGSGFFLARKPAGSESCVEHDKYEQILCVKKDSNLDDPTSVTDVNRNCRLRNPYSGPDVTKQDIEQAPEYVPELSIELEDAPISATEEARMKCWLQKYKETILAYEQKYQVDRRAIAGAIAWEALVNKHGKSKMLLSRGAIAAGKPQIRQFRIPFIEGNPITKQVEEAGYLPKRTRNERWDYIGEKPEHAIEYIAAILSAYADVVEKHGFCIRWNPPILTNYYAGPGTDSEGRELKVVDEKVAKKRITKDHEFKTGNPMALWVENNMGILESILGQPPKEMQESCNKILLDDKILELLELEEELAELEAQFFQSKPENFAEQSTLTPDVPSNMDQTSFERYAYLTKEIEKKHKVRKQMKFRLKHKQVEKKMEAHRKEKESLEITFCRSGQEYFFEPGVQKLMDQATYQRYISLTEEIHKERDELRRLQLILEKQGLEDKLEKEIEEKENFETTYSGSSSIFLPEQPISNPSIANMMNPETSERYTRLSNDISKDILSFEKYRRWAKREEVKKIGIEIYQIQVEINQLNNEISEKQKSKSPTFQVDESVSTSSIEMLTQHVLELNKQKESLIKMRNTMANSLTTSARKFSQKSKPWGPKDYGSCSPNHNVAYAGCGPTSLAIVLNYLMELDNPEKGGALISPTETVPYAEKHGRVCDHGTAPRPMTEGISSQWPEYRGRFLSIGSSGVAEATEELQAGNLVIIHCKGQFGLNAKKQALPPRDGHYMVLSGVSPDRNIYNVIDPEDMRVVFIEKAQLEDTNVTVDFIVVERLVSK
jgi:hypothetical protein